MKKIFGHIFGILLPVFLFGQTPTQALFEKVTHGYADNNGVKIHYVHLGKGPLVVMLHGFPDYWYTWRHQMWALPKVKMPVLAIFGTLDRYVLKGGLNNTWDWLEQDFTLVTIPHADHFVMQDAPKLVSNSMKMWLLRDR